MSAPRIALVTGANRGLGLETAKQLGALGMRVWLGARDAAKAEAAAKQLRAHGHDVRGIALDITNPAHCAAAHDALLKDAGRLDVLVNNAGVAREYDQPADCVSMDVLRQVMEINYFGSVMITQAVLPLLRKSGAARIVNVSSRLGSLSISATMPEDLYYNQLGYNSSKAALNMFTVLLAKQLKKEGIKVNAAHPGWVRTEMGGVDATLAVEEGAKTAVWLATLPENGPTGGYFHMQEPLPW